MVCGNIAIFYARDDITMTDSIIMMASVTHALKARDLLKSMNIKVRVIKTPKELKSCGCGYSIKVSEDVDKIKAILIKNDISFLEQ